MVDIKVGVVEGGWQGALRARIIDRGIRPETTLDHDYLHTRSTIPHGVKAEVIT